MKKELKYPFDNSSFKKLNKELIWKNKDETKKRLFNEIVLLENRK